MAGVTVQVYGNPCYTDFITQVQTDGNGQYQIDNLPAGDVWVLACPSCSNMTYLDTWYGNDPYDDNCDTAAAVTVTDGGNETANFSLVSGPRIMGFFDLAVAGGNLSAGFQLLPWATDLIDSAVLQFPNAGRPDYTFDLVNDRLHWDSECRPVPDFWTYNGGGAAVTEDYGTYTLTLTLKGGLQHTYTKELVADTVTPAQDGSVNATVNTDGSIDVAWTADGTPFSGQEWQVRIRELSGREVFRRGGYGESTIAANLGAADLDCLDIGGDYRMLIRAYSPNGMIHETVEQAFTYAPSAMEDRVQWVDVSMANGVLGVGFDIRPASRSGLTGASVTLPDGTTTVDFDLTADWFDISTTSRTSRGWWRDGITPAADGTYTFTFDFSDGIQVVQTQSFAWADVTGVDSNTMHADVQPNGGVNFQWTLPDGVTGQNYQVRVRSDDGGLEYFKSGTFTDQSQIYANWYELRGLVPGRQYTWQLRVYDASGQNSDRVQSSFYYDPYDFAGPDVLYWAEAAVYEGDLSLNFSVLPGFRGSLEAAYVKIPNSARAEFPEYAYDLVGDRNLWDAECRYVDWWGKTFGAVQNDDYATYALVLVFSTGDTNKKHIRLYETRLADVTAPTPATTAIAVTVDNDGTAHVTWTPDGAVVDGQLFQVRVREDDGGNPGREVYKSQNLSAATVSLDIPAADLGCVALGQPYWWLVRAYDSQMLKAETVMIQQAYAPAANDLGAVRIGSVYIADHKGQLGLFFDTRPADRGHVHSAKIDGPNGFSYTFDLAADWSDMSSETRVSKGWFHSDGSWPIAGGDYTLSVEFDDDGNGSVDDTVSFVKTLTPSTLAAVDPSTLASQVNGDGSVTFSWALPDGASAPQNYQVRIRSTDHSVEYVSTSPVTDQGTLTVGFWDLRALGHGQSYAWVLRAFDNDYDTMVEAGYPTFFYDPFYLYSAPVDTLSGTVTETGGTTPIANVRIRVYTDPCGGEVAWTETAGDGTYSVSGVPTGDVFVEACTGLGCNSLPYMGQWSGGGTQCWEAQPVVAGDTVDFQLAPARQIYGTVTAAGGGGIADVGVSAVADACSGGQWYDGTTDGSGSYMIHVPDDGLSYYVRACPACRGQNYVNEWWNGSAGSGTNDCAQASAATFGAMAPVDFELTPADPITGRVTDPTSGAGVANLHVRAEEGSCGGVQVDGTNTDDQGYYTLMVAVGSQVYIEACATCTGSDQQPFPYVNEWYHSGNGDVYYCQDAEPVPAGTTGADFALDPGRVIAGTVTTGDPAAPIDGLWMDAVRSDSCSGGGDWISFGSATGSNGEYTIRVPDDGWDFLVRACPTCWPQQNFVERWWDGTGGSGSSSCNDALAVPFDGTTQDFHLAPGGSVSGYVFDDSSAPMVDVLVEAFDAPCGNWLGADRTGADGYYEISGLPAGDVYVQVCTECDLLNYANTWYNGSSGYDVGTYDCFGAEPVTVVADQTQSVKDFTMQELGARPVIGTHLNHGWVEGSGFPASTEVTVRLAGGGKGTSSAIMTGNTGQFSSGWVGFQATSPLEKGDLVEVLIGDTVVASMTLADLGGIAHWQDDTITGFARDAAGDPLSGHALATRIYPPEWGSTVHTQFASPTDPDINGAFTIQLLFDLIGGNHVDLAVWDSAFGSTSGNYTVAEGRIPYLHGDASRNSLGGRQFPADTLVTVSFGGTDADYTTSEHGDFWADLCNDFGNCDLAVGDVITAAFDGGSAELTVQNLTGLADVDTNIVSGTASPAPGYDPVEGWRVTLDVFQENSGYHHEEGSISGGMYQFDTDTADDSWDLLLHQEITVDLFDPATGGVTRVQPYNTVPWLTTHIGDNWIQGHNFPPEAGVLLTATDPQGGPKFQDVSVATDGSGFFNANGWDLWNGQQVGTGDTVSADAGIVSADMVPVDLHATLDVHGDNAFGRAFDVGGTNPMTGHALRCWAYFVDGDAWNDIGNGGGSVLSDGSFSIAPDPPADLSFDHRMNIALWHDPTGVESGHRTMTRALFLGDVNRDDAANLADAIRALQMAAGEAPAFTVTTDADVNADGRIGAAEAMYLLQLEAGLRPVFQPPLN